MDVDLVLELLVIFVLAVKLWFCLRWRKRSRPGTAPCSKNKVALTNQKNDTKKHTRPHTIETKIGPDEGLSAAGCFGYAASYLSEVLGKIGLSDKEKNPDYIRGLSVYSMSAVANIGKLATGAHAYPSVEGWEEQTKDNVLVRSLSWNWVNETAPDVVKIVLKGVEMTPQRSSPTLQFSISWSTKFSDTFTQATHKNPMTFYISGRISSVMKEDVSNLCAKITYKTALSMTRTIEFQPKPLKDIDPKKADTWTSKDGSVILHLTLSTVTFSSICPDAPEKHKSSKCRRKWDTSVLVFDKVAWGNALHLAKLGDFNFESCVCIDNQKSSTQSWIFRLVNSKTVAIAFRGNQIDRIYDRFVGAKKYIDCLQRVFSFDPEDPCILDLNPVIDTLHLRVHRGFFTGYLSVRDTVLETVYQMTEGWNSDWSIVVTGHALGASTAILCGAELANRTLKGKQPNVSSLLFAPEQGTIRLWTSTTSYRVVNQIDYLGTISMEYLYDHVPRKIHCLDRVKWTYSLPDSSKRENKVKETIVSQIEDSWPRKAMVAASEFSEIPPGLENRLLGSYLYTTWQILKRMHKLPALSPPQIEGVSEENHRILSRRVSIVFCLKLFV